MQWYLNRVDSDITVGREEFIDECCLVAKHNESFIKGTENTFGVVATGYKAWQRIVDRLQQERSRKEVLQWLRFQAPAGQTKAAEFGIEEVQIVVSEMEKLKVGKHPALAAALEGQATPSEVASSGDAAGSASSAGAPKSGWVEQDNIRTVVSFLGKQATFHDLEKGL